ncbi:SDR family oxidoreductase [Skermania sp. ID1734]|nr:SDR family oxidoreductase [Skermania sp. ID1734]
MSGGRRVAGGECADGRRQIRCAFGLGTEAEGRATCSAGVSLGPIDTDLVPAGAETGALESAAGMTVLGRIGQARDVADLVALLGGPDSAWVTGRNIRVDGGLA